MTGNFENLVEGAIYRLKGREYLGRFNSSDPSLFELCTLDTGSLSYRIKTNGDVVSTRPRNRPSGTTINDLEFVRLGEGK
jgi:hypothetical protein